jgi:alpha-methylacyl-CoA racemase
VKVVEIAGLGPAPFCGMMLADLGADVVTIDRADACVGSTPDSVKHNLYGRGRRSVGVDLKHPGGVEVVARLCDDADVFLEGMRPGVTERLGIGPDVLCGRNARLVYGRMTGWGQDGPLAPRAGHDINYIGVAGPLYHIGRAGGPPTVPLNLVGDFGGGGMLLALGICAALVERATSGEGQVIDAAMVDGAALLLAPVFPAYDLGHWHDERGTNALDGGAPYYDCYECADGRWLSVGALEPQFYAALLKGLGLADADGVPLADLPDQNDEASWPATKERFAAIFASRPRDEWIAVFEGVDACVAPVHSMGEVADDPHLRARGTYIEKDDTLQPAPAPRFSRTPAALDRPPDPPGHHTVEVLTETGFAADEIDGLRAAGAIA